MKGCRTCVPVADVGDILTKLLHYYAHPGERHSLVNKAMFEAAGQVKGIESIDLYARYPRYQIDIDREQALLAEHDVILLQFPIFWYSTPSLVKEWIDLVFEYGWAYGEGGDKLKGKVMMLAVTTGSPESAYGESGYQHYDLRTFLTPLEQTARLCGMRFVAPYVLFGGRHVDYSSHVAGFSQLLTAIHERRFDFDAAENLGIMRAATLPLMEAAQS